MNDNSINIDYNKYYTETLSSSQMSDIRERHNTEDMLQSLAVTGGVVGLGTYGYNQAKKNNKVLEMVENLPGAKLLTERLQNGYQGAEYIQPPSSSGGPQPISRSLHSMLLAAEEASPLHIAKTLGLSSFQTLFVDVVDQEKQTIKIGSDSIRAYSEYYRNLVLNSSGYALTRKDIQNGFLLEGNKLFLANKDGTKGREIAGYARIISTNTTIGHQDSPNRVFQKFANIVGADVHVSQFKQEPLAIVAGTNKAQVMQDWSRAYARFGTEIGFKVLDNPLGFIEEMSGNLGVDTQNSKLFNNKFVTTFKRHINLGLGANGVYNKGNREAMKIMAKNLGIKATGAYTSYVTVNHLLEKITGEDNPWHNGIGAGITNMYAKMRIGFAKVWSDNLQYIREEQEEAAPESTNLMSLAALPLGGAMLGANIAYFKRMRDIASKGFDEGARINTEIKKFDGTVGKILDKVKLNPKGTTLARYGKLGALAGAALTIPFLPGALVGRSSEELRAEFEGTSDVAVRRNRGWLFCMTSDTPVFTTDGLKRADEVTISDKLFNRHGKTQSILDICKRYTKEEVFSFVVNNNPIYTKITGNHEVLTNRGWIQAKDVTLEDKLVVGTPEYNDNNILLDVKAYLNLESKYIEDNFIYKTQRNKAGRYQVVKGYKIPEYLLLDFDLGLFLGWFLAEGCTSQDGQGRHRSLDIAFHESEVVFAQKIWEFLNKLLGQDKEFVLHNNSGNGKRIRYSSSLLSEFLINFMYRDGKKIFPDLSNKPKEFIRGFLVGMFYGDGGIKIDSKTNTRSVFNLTSSTLQHITEFRRYASIFGVYGSTTVGRDGYSYRLAFSSYQGYLFNKNVGGYKQLYTYQEANFNQLAINNHENMFKDGVIYLAIKSIDSYVYEGYVYDYMMDGVPEYTPGAFVIHNSGEAYEGGQIKYHRKSLVKESVTDARNKTLYKDGDQQRDMDPLVSPFKYLKNPYAFEEAHQHDMPYAVWGMDVTYGSFMGKIFQGTIGQLLKPTIVNPELEKYVTNVEQRLEGELSTTQSLTGTVIKKGEAPVKAITGTSEEGGEAPYTRGDQIAIPVKESRKDVAMQKDGIMLAQSSATVDPTKEAMVGAYAAFSDFTGLKGFTSSSVMDAMGLDPTDQTAPKLAVSGSANTLVDRYQSMQLGDAMGCFVPGTCVYWEEGYLPIEKVKVGYRLVSKNGKLRIVSKVYTKEVNEEILKTTLEDGTIIYSTINHVFPGYKKTNTLAEKAIVLWEVGDKLIRQTPVGSSERLTITSQELIWYKGLVYDLEMSESFLEPSTAHTNYYTVEDILCHNSGEFIRRLLPQSADTRGEEVNPMRNSIAASWLPRDTGRDFGEGNYYEKHEAGYTMLPGSRGFEALHPELKGVDPENYSDAWKYRILQNVARGSKEHNIYRDKLIKEVDTLSDYDKNIFFTAYEQDMARSEEKKFFEYKTEEDKAKMNLFQLAQNTLWEAVSHSESPTEPLTPFRPMAKFLHQRTAIEDYRRTQLAGSDAAIWTKPIDHFINPTINRHIQLLDEFYKPRDVQEKESIDEYFDNLKLVKSSQGRPYDANNTIVSAAYSGMRNAADMEAFKRALPDNQKAYVESFASEKDEKKRSEILEMLPSNIGRVYKSIWANIDEYDNAVSSGQDPNKRLRDLYLREAEALKKETGITLTRQEIEGINKASYEIRDKEERENFIAEEQAAKVRAKAAQQEAQDYVEEVTGTPDSSWIGWDNRLTIDDIKLKTLSIGKEDITRFGYWSEEQQRNDRIVALDNDTQVVNRLKEIKKELRDNQDNKHLLKRRLRDEGYDVHDISTTPGAGTVNINND